MRTLLVELRPAALTEPRLGELLRQLAKSASARTGLRVAVTVGGECCLPSEVQVALYRIAQEALSNAVRHAQASPIAVTLRSGPTEVELAVNDDGRGFKHVSERPCHFGMKTMRERADEIGAWFRVESQSGKGTQVMVRWQTRQA